MTDERTIEELNIRTPFWLDDWEVLLNNIDEFYPTTDMNLVEKLNAIVRLSVYVGIILSLVMVNYMYMYIPLIIAIFTIFIYKMQKDNIEEYFREYETNTTPGECRKPTIDNPFMNFNEITSDRNEPPACEAQDNPEIQKDIEEKFNYNLFRDVGDLYGKNNSQREFYTMPVTTAVNNQTSFAKWLYNTGPTCKESAIKCAPETDYTSQKSNEQIFSQFVNN